MSLAEQTYSDIPPFELNEVGYKIFMDRYAWKDHKKELKVGDIVVIDIGDDIKWKQKEPAIVRAIGIEDNSIKIEGNKFMIDGIGNPIDTGHDMQEFGLETLYGNQLFVRKRYELDICKESTIEEARDRMAYAQAVHETESGTSGRLSYWRDEFNWLLDDARYVPAGRVWTSLGTDQNLTYFNCFVIPSPEDSMSGIRKTLEYKQETMRRGGGVGINLSSLRPRGAYARGVNGRSSGAVSWGALYSYSTGLIEQGGSRRGALMLILNIWHPDIVEFICSKNSPQNIARFKEKYLNKFPGATIHPHGVDNANISVGITDEFMEAVENDDEWQLIFPDYEAVDKEVYHAEWNGVIEDWIAKGYPVKSYETYRARDLWDLIIESAWQSAEPGLFFITRYNKEGNQWYYEPIICTNPCKVAHCTAS